MNKINESFEKIVENYDVVLLDGSITHKKFSPYKKIHESFLKEFGIKINTWINIRDDVKHVQEITEAINRYPQIQTLENVIKELTRGLSNLGGIYGKHKNGNLKNYIAALKGFKNKLSSRIIKFEGEEEKNFKDLEKRYLYFKKIYKLSPTDFELLITSVNSAFYKGDTAIFTNDCELLEATIELKDMIFLGGETLRYKLDAYTNLYREEFYRYEPFVRIKIKEESGY